jgi:transposase
MIVKSRDELDKLSQKRKLFQEELRRYDVESMVFIDETGFNKDTVRSKTGLARKGKRLHSPLQQDYVPHRSLLMAVTSSEVLNYHIINKSFNTESFRDFIKSTVDILHSSNKDNKSYVFIFDNASFHKSANTLKLITDAGHAYMFTPPYSPNNNAIENYFSLLKRIYSKVDYDNKINEAKNISVDDRIEESISLLQLQYKDIFKKLCHRTIVFDYVDIEKELRDRIIFLE